MSDLLSKNIEALRKSDSVLARRMEEIALPPHVRVSTAKDGLPVLQINEVYLHSAYHPQTEAERQAGSFLPKPGSRIVVFGLGLGYHVREILRRNPGAQLLVVEPSREVFRAFIETIDLTSFLPHARFYVDESPEKLVARFHDSNWEVFRHQPSLRFCPEYYSRLDECLRLKEYLSKKSLRVLLVPPIYGGSLPTARYCAEALRTMGHSVEWVECDQFADSFHAVQKVTPNPSHAQVLLRKFMEMITEAVAAKAAGFKPDLILALAQAPLMPEAIRHLKSASVPVAFWFVEDFKTLPYWKDVAREYDHFFTIQRGEFFDELTRHGAKNFHYLPQACLPAVHRPLLLSEDEKRGFGADVSFMGAAYYNRVKSFPRLMGYDFKIWGTGWNDTPVLSSRLQMGGKRVDADGCVKIFNAAKINLNLHSSSFHEGVNPFGDFVNPRTFELAACRAFQLVDERSELHDLFEVGREIVTFNDLDDLRDKIDYFLTRDDERICYSAAAYDRALGEHTMAHRMSEMLLHVFAGKFDWLVSRLSSRQSPLEFFIESAGRETVLGRYLGQFSGCKEFNLGMVAEAIGEGKGALTDNELLLLMTGQLVKEKV